MQKRSTMQSKTSHIAGDRIPLKIGSHALRRLVRMSAYNCAMKHVEDKGVTDAKLRRLTRLYRYTLFTLLSVGGAKNLLAAKNSSEDDCEIDFEIEVGDGHFFEALKDLASKKKRQLSSRRALISRLTEARIHCTQSTLGTAVENMDVLYEMQRELGIPRQAISDAHTQPVSMGQVIREARPWERTDPPLLVGENGSFFGMDSIHPLDINNSIAIGGTGSGKTRSYLMPLMDAMLRYRLNDGTVSSMLIIDPKKELLDVVRQTLAESGQSERLVVIGECPPISMFANDLGLSVEDKIQKIQAFGPQDKPEGETGYWVNLGRAVLLDFMHLEVVFAQQTGGQRLFARMCADLRIPGTRGKGLWAQVRAVLTHARSGRSRLREVDALLRLYCRLARIENRSVQVAQVYCGDDDLFRQFGYGVQSIDPNLVAWSNADGHLLDLDLIPKEGANALNIMQTLEEGRVVVFCPEPTQSHRTIAKALKTKYYESVFARRTQSRPVGIVVDELQNFITGDASGEQSFMDRNRAYRCLVVSATQSIASLKYALGGTAQAQSAVEIVMANSPSRFVFRTTDADSVSWLKTQIPTSGSDGDPHVVDIRRPAGMRAGEAYYMLATGQWGRRSAGLRKIGAGVTSQPSSNASPLTGQIGHTLNNNREGKLL